MNVPGSTYVLEQDNMRGLKGYAFPTQNMEAVGFEHGSKSTLQLMIKSRTFCPVVVFFFFFSGAALLLQGTQFDFNWERNMLKAVASSLPQPSFLFPLKKGNILPFSSFLRELVKEKWT